MKINISANLPHSIESELNVLSSILIDEKCLNEVRTILKPEHFFESKHQILYSSLLSLSNEDKPIDQVMVYEKLKSDQQLEGAGGLNYISKLTKYYLTSANVGYHSRVIFEKYLSRQLVKKCSTIINRADKNNDIYDLLSAAEKQIGGINSEFSLIGDDERPLSERLSIIFSDLEERSKG